MPRSTPEQRGWYLYDFANSAFQTTAITLFLGPYLTSLAKAAAAPDGLVHPLGIPVDPRSFWSYAIGVSVGAQVLFLPMIGALADFGRHKRRILGLTAYLGAGVTAALFFVQGRNYLAGGALFIVANVSFGAAEAIYNSFLPEIASIEHRDAV